MNQADADKLLEVTEALDVAVSDRSVHGDSVVVTGAMILVDRAVAGALAAIEKITVETMAEDVRRLSYPIGVFLRCAPSISKLLQDRLLLRTSKLSLALLRESSNPRWRPYDAMDGGPEEPVTKGKS